MQVQVIVNSAHALKNVNWRYGMLHPYAVLWIDRSHKCSTKVDMSNGMNPVWDEKFTYNLPPTSFPETAILNIDIVHANAPPGTKPLIGSVRFPLNAAINEARAHGKVPLCLNLKRPSGRPQGTVEIKITVKDPNMGQINQYNQQQTPHKQHVAAQPLPQVQMQPQVHFRPQGQYQPRPQVQLQGQFQPRPQVQPQGQFQPRPQIQLQGQYLPQPQPQVRPQGQYQIRQQVQPQPQVQPQGQFQPQPVVQPQGQFQPQPVVQPQGQYQIRPQVQPQGQSQPRPQPQPRPKSQQQVPQVQPTKKQTNKAAPVHPPNAKGPVRQTPGQEPRSSMPAATNRPRYRQGNPVPVQQQYNPAFGMDPGAGATRMSRAMLIAQTQNGLLANNVNNNNAAPGDAGANDNEETKSAAAGPNDNGETNSAANANNAVDNSNAEKVEEAHSVETFNDAESIHLSYEETQYASVGSDNGGYSYSEYAATEENHNGDYDVNAGHGECDNGGNDMDAGAECDYGVYDVNAGAECDYGDYDVNASAECDYGVYEMNAGEECDYEAYENGQDYVDGQSDSAFDGAGLDSNVECEEVDVSCDY